MSRLWATIALIIFAAAVANRCVPLSSLWHNIFGSGSVTEGTTSACLIKGNINRSGERIYHLPGRPYYDATEIDIRRGERWFCTEAEARSAGWRKSRAY